MELNARQSDGVHVLELKGRLDAYEVPAVADRLQVTAADSGQVVINMSGVGFVDSTALAALVQGMKRCRQQGGDLALSNLQQPVRIIFELTRLDRAFSIFPSEADALASFGT